MKKALSLLLICAVVLSLLTIPGLSEYISLRYFSGISPRHIENAAVTMKLTQEKMNEELSVSTYITAEQIRKLDGEALRNFYSELNRSIDVEQEFAFTRSLHYYQLFALEKGPEEIREQIIADISGDYWRHAKAPIKDINDVVSIIERLAAKDPKLLEQIQPKTEPVGSGQPM